MASNYWDPFRNALTLREAMDRLFEHSVVQGHGGQQAPAAGGRAQPLPIDMWETAESLVVRAPMPGAKVEAGDIDISVHRDVLTIRVRLPEAADEKPDTQGRGIRWLHREIPRGEFARTVELPIPVNADKAEAHYGEGLLLLTLPKADAARPRQIKVNIGESGG